MRYVICYDISDNKRRRKVADVLDAYGDRIQNSVFELVASESIFQKCLGKLKQSIDLNYDKITVYKICSACDRKAQYIGLNSNSKRIGLNRVYVV